MTIAILLLNMIPGLLGNIPGLPSSIQALIKTIAGVGASLLSSGAVTQPSVTTVLAAWAGVISTLKQDTTLSPTILNSLAQLEKAVQAALTEDAVAASAVDWTKFTSIALVQ